MLLLSDAVTIILYALITTRVTPVHWFCISNDTSYHVSIVISVSKMPYIL